MTIHSATKICGPKWNPAPFKQMAQLTGTSISLSAYSLKIKAVQYLMHWVWNIYIQGTLHTQNHPHFSFWNLDRAYTDQRNRLCRQLFWFFSKILPKATTPKAQQKPWNSKITAATPHKYCLFFSIPSYVQNSCNPSKHLSTFLNSCYSEHRFLPELTSRSFCSLMQHPD